MPFRRTARGPIFKEKDGMMVMARIAILENPGYTSVNPQWETDLLERLSARHEKVGISLESIPQTTIEALDKLGALTECSRKKQPRQLLKKQRKYKPYVKANVAAFLRACLTVSIQYQLPFTEAEASELGISGGVAVLAIRSIADLAKKIGISADRAQQIIVILIILGFMRRIRTGRQFIYLISLEPYAPYPSPRAVRDDLLKLHRELSIEDSTLSQSSKNRRAGFRKLLEGVLIRFEATYGLTTDEYSSSRFQVDAETVEALQDIKDLLQSRIAPQLCEDLMRGITSVVTKRLGGKTRSCTFTETTFNTQNQYIEADQETTFSLSNRLSPPHVTPTTFLAEKIESTFCPLPRQDKTTFADTKVVLSCLKGGETLHHTQHNGTDQVASVPIPSEVSPRDDRLNIQKQEANVVSIPSDEVLYTEFSNISKEISLGNTDITEFSSKEKKQTRKRNKKSTSSQVIEQESILPNNQGDDDNAASFILSEQEIRYQAQVLSYRFDYSDKGIGLYTTRLRENPWILRISVIDALIRGRFPDPKYKPQRLGGGWINQCYVAYRAGKKEIPAEMLAWARTGYGYEQIEEVLDEVSAWQIRNFSKLTRPFPEEVIVDSLALQDFWTEDAAYRLERRGILYVDINGELLPCKKYEEYRIKALSYLLEEEPLALSSEAEYEVQSYLQWVQSWIGWFQADQEIDRSNKHVVEENGIGWSTSEMVNKKADSVIQALPPYFRVEVYPTELETYEIVITNQCIEDDQVVLNSDDQLQDLLQLMERESAKEKESGTTGWSSAIAEWWVDRLQAVLSASYHFDVQVTEEGRYVVGVTDTCNAQRYVFVNNLQIESFLSEYHALRQDIAQTES